MTEPTNIRLRFIIFLLFSKDDCTKLGGYRIENSRLIL